MAIVASTPIGVSFRAADLPPDQLRVLLADYYAFTQLQMFLRLVVIRLVVLGVLATGGGRLFGLLTTVGSLVMAAVFTLRAIVVWMVTSAAPERFAQRLAQLPSAASLADGVDEPDHTKL